MTQKNEKKYSRKHRLIGLDPGLKQLGWGVIEIEQNRLTHIANGSIMSDAKASLPARLLELEIGLEHVFDTWQPEQAAVEETFVNRNGNATLRLGQARAICLLVPARRHLPIAEYAPNFIKRTVTGAGHADKQQMQAMVNMLLPQARPENEHASDALAIAIAHAHGGDIDNKLLVARNAMIDKNIIDKESA